MKISKQIIKEYAQAEFKKELRTALATAADRPFNGYLGWMGFGNLGDEAVREGYDVLFSRLHLKPFRVGSPTKAVAKRLHRAPALASAALGGGTLINQNDAWLDQTEYLLKHDVPMFCMGTGVASPKFWQHHQNVHSADKLARWTNALSKFVFAGVRGPMSQENLANAGFHADVVGDAALALANDTYQKRTTRQVVGVNISYGTEGGMWGDANAFMAHMVNFIRHLMTEGFSVRLLPIWTSDVTISRQIVQDVDDPSCTMISAYRSTPQYVAALGQCDLFVGLKLHATILATMLRIPSIMLEYRPKCLDYMMSVDMPQFSVRTDQVTATGLMRHMQQLITNYDAIAATLDQKVLFYKNLQLQKATYVQQQLGFDPIIEPEAAGIL